MRRDTTFPAVAMGNDQTSSGGRETTDSFCTATNKAFEQVFYDTNLLIYTKDRLLEDYIGRRQNQGYLIS